LQIASAHPTTIARDDQIALSCAAEVLMLDEVRKRFEAMKSIPGRFDSVLAGMEIVSIEAGRAKMRVEVGPGLQNPAGKLHGGAAATIVDVAGTMAIMAGDRDGRPGVSTDLNVSFFAPGEGLIAIDAQVLKHGRTLAFVSVDIRRESDGVLVAQGRMTKAL
jgi:acyl-coenzyme A thioesterase 13